MCGHYLQITLLLLAIAAAADAVGISCVTSAILDHQQCAKRSDEVRNGYNQTYLIHHGVLQNSIDEGLKRRQRKALTEGCKEEIAKHYIHYITSQILEEDALAWDKSNNSIFQSQCHSLAYQEVIKKFPLVPSSFAELYTDIGNTNKSAPLDMLDGDGEIISSNTSVKLLYILLAHDHPELVFRLMGTLSNNGSDETVTFIVHVDKDSESVLQFLLKRLSSHFQNETAIHFISTEERERVSWGGFSIVNATLKCLHFAMDHNISFDYVINLSGRHYPLKSNSFIKESFKQHIYSKTVFMEIASTPLIPQPSPLWQKYVECDKQLHRIGQYRVLHTMHMFQGSQWFAIPRQVAHWFTSDPLPRLYAEYAKYILASDENYFSTLFMNSPFCDLPRSANGLVFVVFDRWESQKPVDQRDPRKCLAIDPSICGRSPITIQEDLVPYLLTSTSMFARKFDPLDKSSMVVIDILDRYRSISRIPHTGQYIHSQPVRVTLFHTNKHDTNHTEIFDHTLNDMKSIQLCMELQPKSKYIKMKPCINTEEGEIVPSVSTHEHSVNNSNSYDHHQQFTIRCMINVPGIESNESLCMLIANHNLDAMNCSDCSDWFWIPSHNDFCLDIAGASHQEGTYLIAHPCNGRWNQIFRIRKNSNVWTFVQPAVLSHFRGSSNRTATDLELCMAMDKAGFLQTTNCISKETRSDIVNLDIISL